MKQSMMLAAAVLMFGCTPPKENATDLQKELVGEWSNLYLKVTMPTVGNSDSTKVTECDITNWEQMLGIKPIHTTFRADGTYDSPHYNLKDSLLFTASGTWNVSGDTLIMDQKQPRPSLIKLRTSIKDGVAEFVSVFDFDEDGQVDDEYIGRQKKH